MQVGQHTGWRQLPPSPHRPRAEFYDATRTELLKAKKLAQEGLELSKANIAILGALVTFFNQPVAGRLLVWPSNETLMQTTGYSERAVRSALSELVALGLLVPKLSANGKRFAVHYANGQIKDAFGFDLSPLVDRAEEFKTLAAERRAERERIRREYDELTICRRSVEAVIQAFESYYPETDIEALRARYADLRIRTPRRALDRAPGPVLGDWRALRDYADAQYSAACAGNSCRHKENNKNSFEQSCQNGQENVRARRAQLTIADVAQACPDAVEAVGGISSQDQLIRTAERERGTYGTSRDAWLEACAAIGQGSAAVAFMLVLQLYCEDQQGRRSIKNFGGLYRSIVRRVAAGEFDLVEEMMKMKRRRRH